MTGFGQLKKIHTVLLTGIVWTALAEPTPNSVKSRSAGNPTNAVSQAAVAPHWAFTPPRRIPPPSLGNSPWIKNGIDGFVLARLEEHRIRPSPEASRATLLRRLSLDLLGIPPTPEELDTFEQDDSPNAYERRVDQLLSSPRFGERWGRHWLDVARYADSDGYEKDTARPQAYHFRDWLLQALNRDLPFDQFTLEQLAGDLLIQPSTSEERRQELLAATGFHRQTLTNKEGGVDAEEDRCKNTIDRASTTGTVWLGLTLGCAECHNHKYDPVSQREFFSFYAFFNSLIETNVPIPTPTELADFNGRKIVWEEIHQRLKEELAAAESASPSAETTIIAQKKKALAAHAKTAPSLPERQLLALQEHPKPRPTHIHVRGDFLRLGEAVQRAFPDIVHHPIQNRSGSNRFTSNLDRRDLAAWLLDPANPLTSRVTANRIWQHLFGFGIVRTPNDFGTRGQPPTHPELLDWLALELIQTGWSQKALIRTIVRSSTYRQSSNWRQDLVEIDPENLNLSRQNRFRLEAESIRDSALAVSGKLDGRIGGPSVRPHLPSDIIALAYANSVKWPESTGGDQYRRGLYTFLQRTVLFPMLTAFDAPDSVTTCSRRERSNTPVQALTLLNDPLFVECAHVVAEGLGRDATPPSSVQFESLFRRILSRNAKATERHRIERLYQEAFNLARKHTQDGSHAARNARLSVTRTLLNLEEFMTRE